MSMAGERVSLTPSGWEREPSAGMPPVAAEGSTVCFS